MRLVFCALVGLGGDAVCCFNVVFGGAYDGMEEVGSVEGKTEAYRGSSGLVRENSVESGCAVAGGEGEGSF